MKKTDVLVIGAGPSGTIAAAIIKKAGFEVTIVEKTLFPRFVIGESLLPRCMSALEEAGFLQAVKDKNFQEKFGAKFILDDGRICDFNFSECFSEGWNWTWQVPRAEFDKTLADECEKQGIEVNYQTEVIDIKFNEDESSVTTVKNIDGSTEEIHAKFIVDGSGYGRVIPRLFNLDKPSTLPVRQTVFTHYEDKNRVKVSGEPNRITIYVYNSKTWVWVIPFSNGNTSVGFVGFPEFFDNLGELSLKDKLLKLVASHPELNARFGDCDMQFDPMEIKGWSATTEKFYGKGFVLTGNVTEFLDPVFSSGVTLASVSAQVASKIVIRKLQGEAVDWESEYMEPCMQGVEVFRTFVDSWYDGDLHAIFFSKGQNDMMRQQICSVLAGYVWDNENPFVKNHAKQVRTLAKFIRETQADSVQV
jgi:flavin-dependent dehydrogenase